MKMCIGRGCGYNERPWEMNGNTGTTRTVTISGGGSEDRYKIPEDTWNRLPKETREAVKGLGGDQFGARVVLVFTIFRGDRKTDLNVQSLAVWDAAGNFVFSNLPDEVEALLGAVPAKG